MNRALEDQAFIGFLLAVSLVLLLILKPFLAPIFWACAAAIVFAPVHQRLVSKFNQRDNLAAAATLGIIVTIVIVPVILVAIAVLSQGVNFYERLETGEINLEEIVSEIIARFPFVQDLFVRFDVKLDDLQEQVTNAAMAMGTFLTERSLVIGQNAFQFVINIGVMIYLTFFLLRDGRRIAGDVLQAFPLRNDRGRLLFDKFSEAIRAIVEGNIAVAAVQGALGAFVFWVLGIPGPILWGVVMAVFSLIPVIGAALIWVPVALYLFAIGSYLDGIILVAFGALIIGMVDNFFRHKFVERSLKLPDYIVLLTTLGGIALVGIHGFVVGPLVAALFMAFWAMFVREFDPSTR